MIESTMISQERSKRTKAALAATKHRMERYRECFGSADGQWVLADLRLACHSKPSYVAGLSFDQVAFNEGAKAVLRRIEGCLDDTALSEVNKLERELRNQQP